MSCFRIYAEKSNTIASGFYENINSGQNAISNLWYGGGLGTNATNFYRRNSISRLLIYFDLTDLQSKINDMQINQSLINSYRLVIKNAIPSDVTLEPEYEYDVLDKSVAASFNLTCFILNKPWDQGRNYDLDAQKNLIKQVGTNSNTTGYSNWISCSSTENWTENGVYTNPTASTIFHTNQQFDIGDEDISMNISNIVNNWLSGGSTNYGLGIAYSRNFELLSTDTRYISSFVTEKTNTCFKPYIEVNYNQTIKDDRKTVSNNKLSHLYLYTFSAHSPTNIVLSAVTVDIKLGNTTTYSNLVPTQLQKGVYYVSVWMSGATAGQKYTDVWKNVQFNPPYDTQDITQTFQIQKDFYTGVSPKINNYILDIYGIENNSIISQEENIRLFCDLRTAYSTNAPTTPYELQYKLTMNNQLDVIGWTSVNRAVFDGCETNFVDIDSTWLLHNQTYQFVFKINEMGTSRILPETLTFRVLREFS